MSGILFSALQLAIVGYFAVFVLPVLGPIDAPIADRAAAYIEAETLLRLGNWLFGLPAIFLLFFLGGLHSALRRLEGGETLATAAVAAGAAMAMIWPLSGIFVDVGINMARAGGEPVTIWAFDALAPYSLALSAVPRAVLIAAVSAALLESRGAPGWLGWSGHAVAALSLAGSAMPVAHGLFPLLGLSTLLFLLWIVGLAVALLRGGVSPAASAR